jgi:transposase, IS5 family
MYKKVEQHVAESENFELPFGAKLAEDNRWVIMAKLIPWSEVEGVAGDPRREEYAKKFTLSIGAPAKSSRMALGALIIKEKLGISDRESVAGHPPSTVEQIRENPYLQYFIGLKSYSNEPPFEASMLVHFRERLEVDLVKKINLKMCQDKIEENGGKVETAKK